MVTSIKGNATSTFGGNVDVTGNVVTDAPAFSAYKSSDQSVSASVFTKVTFDTEHFDTNNNFADSKFTPTVAGYYQVNSNILFDATSGLTRLMAIIYKNGQRYNWIGYHEGYNNDEGAICGSALIYMNGTTDYLEVYGFLDGTTPLFRGGNDSTTNSYTHFSGFLARAV